MPDNLTVLDFILIAVVLLAAVAGFRRSGGAERTGRLVGLLVGTAIALPLAAVFAPAGSGPVAQGLLRLTGLALGLLLGMWVGGAIGGLVSRGLVHGKLGVVDHALGAVAAAGTTLLVVWALATGIPMVVGAQALTPVTAAMGSLGGHSQVLRAVDSRLPLANQTLGEAIHTAP